MPKTVLLAGTVKVTNAGGDLAPFLHGRSPPPGAAPLSSPTTCPSTTRSHRPNGVKCWLRL